MDHQEPIPKPEAAELTEDVVGVDVPPLVRRLRNYHRQLDSHQRKREAAVLLADAADEIEKLWNALEQFYAVNTRFGIGGFGMMEYQKANFDAREALFPPNAKCAATGSERNDHE